VDGKQADEAAEEDQVTVSPWFLKKLIKHLDNYSIVCVFKLMLHVANGIYQGSPDSMQTSQISGVHINGDWGSDMEAFQEAVDKVKRMWSGAEGTALTVLSALENSTNPETHLNVTEVLVDMVQLFADRDESGEAMLDEDGRVIEDDGSNGLGMTSFGHEGTEHEFNEGESAQHSSP
jgi:hypothetical protein